ncbi:MAG: hypothetical protein KAH10_00295 [Flavobacteriales bacterium]|nr:hypothetical protein [Flavobacteriales bacterium]
MKNNKLHSFHIPVMGIGFTIDTPLKVAQYGISSVISTVDDMLVERLRKFYSEKFDLPFQEITTKVDDFRAKRFTAYLDMLHDVASDSLEEIKKSFQNKTTKELDKLIDLLPDVSDIKNKLQDLLNNNTSKQDVYEWLNKNLQLGDIDVNIMTKVDRDNYRNGKKLPPEYNDALAALRGFANSKLQSSVVLSAGMNPRLYGYIDKFEDFFPDENFNLRKRIILKVSDYRSALIQGKYLAKRGIWISEYRIESGLNCGGHAFATDGFLVGPILEEFKKNRGSLIEQVHDLYIKALDEKGKRIPQKPFDVKITAQGGVGTSEEHEFLLDHYKLDSIGWGSPFLLVPEAISLDKETLDKLSNAKEDDLYLSNISPLGVPFNSLRGNTKDIEKDELIFEGKPGSKCPKEFVKLNTEFGERALCVASRQYQTKKIKELDLKELPELEHKKQYKNITDKSCICVGLSTATLITNNLDYTIEGPGVSVCPGPNLAYFEGEHSLKDMVGHIYGRKNIITRDDRPNMFVKELSLYIDYFKNQLSELSVESSKKEIMGLKKFQRNLNAGIEYYLDMFDSATTAAIEHRDKILFDFIALRDDLNKLTIQTIQVTS